MEVFGDVHQLCPCYKKYQDFHKLNEFKDFVVYFYPMRTENVRKGGAVKSAASATRYVFILHNKNDVKIKTSKIMSESGMKNISCPRCKNIFEHVQKLMQDIQSIDRNTVMGICDECRKNAQTNDNPFCACEEIVKKFLSVEGKQKGDAENRVKIWLSKIRHFEDSAKTLNKSKQIKSHAYSSLKISQDLKSPTPRHDPKVEQMFYSHKHFQSDDTEMSETDLKEQTQPVGLTQPTETLRTSLAHTPHEGEKKVTIIPRASMAVSGAGLRDLPRPSLKQENIFQYDIPSMDAKEVLKIRHDRSLRHMMRYKKEADDPFSLTEKADVYDITKKSPWEEKEPKSRHDLGPGGTPVPHYVTSSSVTSPKTLQKDLQDQLSKVEKHHQTLRRNVSKFDHKTKKLDQYIAKLKNGPSQAVRDVVHPQYSFFFPKEKEKEEQKAKLHVSSTKLIKDTQEKYRLKAELEKKRKDEERQQKLQKEEKKKLALEEKRFAREEKKQAEEKRRKDIEEQKRLTQEKNLSEKNLEPNESQQKIKAKTDEELDEINKDKISKTKKDVDKSKPAEKDINKVNDEEQKSNGDQISKAEKPQSKSKDYLISKGKQETKGKVDELTQKQKEDEENKRGLSQEQSQKAKEDEAEKESLKQEQSQKGKEDESEKERLKQEQSQKATEDKDEKERLKQEQLPKSKKGKAEKERLKEDNLQKAKEDKDEKERLKQEQLPKSKKGKAEKDRLEQEQSQKEKKKKNREPQLKEIDAASKKGVSKQGEIVARDETVSVKKGEKEKASKRKTSKNEPPADPTELADDFQKLQKDRLKEKEAALKSKKQEQTKALAAKAKKESERKLKASELPMKDIKFHKSNKDMDALGMVQIKQAALKRPGNIAPELLEEHNRHLDKARELCPLSLNSELELEVLSLDNQLKRKIEKNTDIIIGEKIVKYNPHPMSVEERAGVPLLFRKKFIERADKPHTEIEKMILKKSISVSQGSNKGILLYALSDRTYIDKGWTMLPTEKIMRKMNIYRMRPAHPEFDWFEHNKKKGMMTYDTGEKLAEFDDNGRGRLYYKNGRLALDYYDAKETNAQQRFVTYSSGEPDERGRTHPITILSTFDHLGNGIVFDHAGKIRLKYNQTEGVVLDRGIGPVSHWKWHSLNDPPVLQQVMIDTYMAHKDPNILKLGSHTEQESRPDNEEMLAIEFDNFIKEKSKKLTQKFKPFQIKMKALKINEHFSLKVLDQATVYLIFRDGSANVKLNIGMILDHQEIVDTDTAEVGEVANNLERFPARTDSIEGLQRSVAHAQHYERQQTERERRLRPPEPSASADRLTAAASRPMRPPFRTLPPKGTSSSTSAGYRSRKPGNNLYYNTRLL